MGSKNNTGKQKSKESVFSNPVVITALITGIFGLLIALISNWNKIGWNNSSRPIQTAVPSNQNTSSIPVPTVPNSGNSQSIGDISAGGDVDIKQEMNNK